MTFYVAHDNHTIIGYAQDPGIAIERANEAQGDDWNPIWIAECDGVVYDALCEGLNSALENWEVVDGVVTANDYLTRLMDILRS